MLDTNVSGWRFDVNENVTRAPEVGAALRISVFFGFWSLYNSVHMYYLLFIIIIYYYYDIFLTNTPPRFETIFYVNVYTLFFTLCTEVISTAKQNAKVARLSASKPLEVLRVNHDFNITEMVRGQMMR